MATRLDRLVVLLETGSTTLVRTTAAQQLSDIQRQHPHELYNLLARVAPYLRNREWECRVAAGKAIGGIADNVTQWDPNGEDSMQDVKTETPLHEIKEESDLKIEGSDDSMLVDKGTENGEEDLWVNNFDPVQVLRNGQKLLGSAGKVRDLITTKLIPRSMMWPGNSI